MLRVDPAVGPGQRCRVGIGCQVGEHVRQRQPDEATHPCAVRSGQTHLDHGGADAGDDVGQGVDERPVEVEADGAGSHVGQANRR